MSTPEHPSTAQILGALRQNLLSEGFSADLVDDLVRMAALEWFKDHGVSVRYAEMAQS